MESYHGIRPLRCTESLSLTNDSRDFNAPVENRPADSSAATIVATGLLLLSKVETDILNRVKWWTAAINVRYSGSALSLTRLTLFRS